MFDYPTEEKRGKRSETTSCFGTSQCLSHRKDSHGQMCVKSVNWLFGVKVDLGLKEKKCG